MTTIITAQNFHDRTAPGSMGVVTNTRFVRCYWPPLDQPSALFAPGSSGIEVQGPPTPRNVVFPGDTVFLPVVVNDAPLNGLARWRLTDIPTRGDCYFVRSKEMQDVEEEREATEQLLVRGEVRTVHFIERVTVRREFDVIRELTVEEAKDIAMRSR